MLLQTMTLGWLVASLSAPAPSQPAVYKPQKARRHFVSVSYDWQYTHSMGFRTHPLEDLLGQSVDEVHLQTYDYRTADGILIDVLDFTNHGQGLGVTVYPFGSSEGATLALRGSVEQLPNIMVRFEGPAPFPSYVLSGGTALDVAVGVDVSDRSPGWGLGSHAFLLGGIGRALADERGGSRYFAEGGGGVAVGPFGVDLSVKVAMNRFSEPVPHRFMTIPISVRGTLSF